MQPIQDQLQENFTEIKKRLAMFAEENELSQKASIYSTKVKETIKKYPIPSLIIGLAAGFVIGKLLSDSQESEKSEE
jgi:ElaB/YqjD/DUF883 family membrane-anchored ribosome-binding protein